MFSLICVWLNGWVNSREAGDLRRHRAHYDVIVMISRHYRDVAWASWRLKSPALRPFVEQANKKSNLLHCYSFVMGINQRRMDSLYKGTLIRKSFPNSEVPWHNNERLMQWFTNKHKMWEDEPANNRNQWFPDPQLLSNIACWRTIALYVCWVIWFVQHGRAGYNRCHTMMVVDDLAPTWCQVICISATIMTAYTSGYLWALLVTWFNFNHSMDK